MSKDLQPQISVRNRQRTTPLSTGSLHAFAKIALSLTWPRRADRSDINSVSSVLVSIVSDKQLAQLHQRFCGIAGPTDVLTFQHGEIVISAQTAERQARVFRTSLVYELRLYLLHGLLHLCGYDDKDRRARAAMERMQRKLFDIATRRSR
jgi:probable rRNA maturation factor